MDFVTEHAQQIGLIFFLLFFIGVIVYAYNPRRKKELQDHANIVFDDKTDK